MEIRDHEMFWIHFLYVLFSNPSKTTGPSFFSFHNSHPRLNYACSKIVGSRSFNFRNHWKYFKSKYINIYSLKSVDLNANKIIYIFSLLKLSMVPEIENSRTYNLRTRVILAWMRIMERKKTSSKSFSWRILCNF